MSSTHHHVEESVSARPAEVGQSDVPSEAEALDWAREHCTFDVVERVRNAPWSSVHSLKNGRDEALLEMVPPASRAPAVAHSLALRFKSSVPGFLAAAPERGLLLTRRVRARRLDHELTLPERLRVLREYARMQTASAQESELLDGLVAVQPENQLEQLIAYLRPEGQLPDVEGAYVPAAQVCGREIADRYGPALLRRSDMLQDYLSRASILPVTLNHGDLRPGNIHLCDGSNLSVVAAQEKETGEQQTLCVFSGWDDVSKGPAGLSLHGLFSGASNIAKLTAGQDAGDSSDAHERLLCLDTYIETLADGGYADETTLRHSLGASACAGMIRYLLNFSRFEVVGTRFQRDIRNIFQKRLGDLLDVCDLLSLDKRRRVISHSHDYTDRGRQPRADALLKEHLRRSPNDATALSMRAGLLLERGRFERADRLFRDALQITPDDPDLLCRTADAKLEQLEINEAVAHYRRSLALDASHKRSTRHLQLASELLRARTDAQRDDTIPRLRVSTEEFAKGRMAPPKLALAEQLFLDHGVLIIENVFDPGWIDACKEDFLDKYRPYFENVRHGDALRIGDKRFQVTMDIAGPYNSEQLYGNPFVQPLLHRCLDENFVLGSLTASISLPGSEEQWLHKDHPRMFSRRGEDIVTPPVGVSMMIPLVNLSKQVGTTKVKKGSHLVSLPVSRDMRSLSPYINTGSCFLMDHRLSHKGEPNLSQQVRPIFNALFHRRWFRDSLNFRNQPPIRMSESELEKVPEHLKKLLRWTGDPGPRDA